MDVVGGSTAEVPCAQHVDKEACTTRVPTDSIYQILSRRFELPSVKEVLAKFNVVIVMAKGIFFDLLNCLNVDRESSTRSWVSAAWQVPVGSSPMMGRCVADSPTGICPLPERQPGLKSGMTRSVSMLKGYGDLANLQAWKLPNYVLRDDGFGPLIKALERLEQGGDKGLKAAAKNLLNHSAGGLSFRQYRSDDKQFSEWISKAGTEEREGVVTELQALAGEVAVLMDGEKVKRGSMPSAIKALLDDLRPGIYNSLLEHVDDKSEMKSNILISDEVIEGLRMQIKDGTLKLGQIEGQLKTQGDLDRVRRALGLNEPLAS